MSTIYNFSAGPAVLPRAVLEQAQAEMLEWSGSGMSVTEMSHRSKEFLSIAEDAERTLNSLLGLSDEYQVLFLQGGATTQFSIIPMNLLVDARGADYICTGQWSKKAIKEGKKIGSIHVAATSEDRNFADVPSYDSWDLRSDSSYVHITSNETIGGVEFHDYPPNLPSPLVADMSSHILSRPLDVSQFGLIYAGAQKNIGPAGLTIVIIRKDLLARVSSDLPSMFSYAVQADNQSMFNTPPTYAIYVAGLVFKWLEEQGGLSSIEQKNIKKSNMIYDQIDLTGFYRSPVPKNCRSRMNIPFRIRDETLEDLFLKDAKDCGLLQLKGHRSVGGIRASIYNAMPIEGVETLLDFMQHFEKKYG
ncbi:MAG: 3-phosphoserine/phosphohydroxythreonine transaminase [Burkholderiales bacterium]|nr:3-phosphoserine/phosphohydroxythreonine transaminase [Burkholderiales bacterium]OUT78695.1 MAG: phosphoserine transaminase [Betaproteobacteria bacterium TMED22]